MSVPRVCTLVNTETATNSASLAFTGIDNTYKEYMFVFYDINPATDGAEFQWNASDDTSSHSYDLSKHSAGWKAYNRETTGDTAIGEETGHTLTNSTSAQKLAFNIGNGSDESAAGWLRIFEPADTTFVKNYFQEMNILQYSNYCYSEMVAGHINTTAAVTAIQFAMSTGNFDGVIQMYGIS